MVGSINGSTNGKILLIESILGCSMSSIFIVMKGQSFVLSRYETGIGIESHFISLVAVYHCEISRAGKTIESQHVHGFGDHFQITDFYLDRRFRQYICIEQYSLNILASFLIYMWPYS